MSFVRAIGRGALGMIVGCIPMALIMACAIEVASHFSDTGGFYLYVRRAFGRFAGLQIAWFWTLAMLGGVAASAHLFVSYLSGLVPQLSGGWQQLLLAMAVLIAIPSGRPNEPV